MVRSVSLCFALLGACTFDGSNVALLGDIEVVDGSTIDARVDSGQRTDASVTDAAALPCTQFSDFSTPTVVTEVSSNSLDNAPSLTADELTLFMHSTRPGGLGGRDLWMATRESRELPFSTPTNLTSVNSSEQEFGVSVSSDGLELYFGSNRAGGSGGYDIWGARRESRDVQFGTPVNIVSVNSTGVDYFPSISSDRLALYIASNRPGGQGGFDIWVATRASVAEEFNTATPFTAINSDSSDQANAISSDGLSFLVQSSRPGSTGGLDVWISTRTSTNSSFGNPIILANINSTSDDQATWFSPDGLRLYQASSRTGSWNIYVSERSCVTR